MSIHDERSHTVKPMRWNPEETADRPPSPGSITEAIDRLNRVIGNLEEVMSLLQKRLGPVLRYEETKDDKSPCARLMTHPCEMATRITASANAAESIFIQVNDISTRLEL